MLLLLSRSHSTNTSVHPQREQGLVGFQTGEEAVRKHSSEDKQALKGSSQTVATRPTRSVYKKRSEVESSVIRPPTSLIQGVPTRRRHHHTRDTANSKPSRRDSTKASDRTRQSIQEVNDLRGRDRTSFLGLRRCKQRVNSSSAPTSVSSAHTSSMATGNRRRSGSWTKKSSNFKSPTSPSVTSILSEITNASGGSSGSNSTVTQDSISRPKSQRPKRSSVAGSETRGRGRKESTSASRSISPAVTERPNVFAFMENDSTTTVGIPARTATTVDDVIEEESGQSELPDVLSESEPEDGDNTSPSVGSHFGVSVPDDSPARLAETGKPQDEHAGQHYTRSQPAYHNAFSPSRTVDRRRPTSANSPPTGGVRRWSSASDSGMGSSVDENCGYDQPISSPEAYYRRPYPKPALRPDEDSPPYSLPDKHMPQQVLERPQVLQANWPKSNITGYELLASNLSSSSRGTDTLTPIYRKFETLNNRILLYLQDEISEIEEDLRKLDEADAQACAAMSGMTEEGGPVPTSRRLEARMPSEIHFRRLELLGRTFLKVGQYSKSNLQVS